MMRSALIAAALVALGCGGESGQTNDDVDGGGDERELPPAAENFARDLLATHLTVDIETMRARAVIELAADASSAASFEIGDLEIASVSDAIGPLLFEDAGDQLNVGVPAETSTITVEYSYTFKQDFNGVLGGGLTFSWPYFCGNMFPCISDPDEGLALGLELSGVPTGEAAVYPREIVADAPSYMLAWAVGDFDYTVLGTTAAGTEVGTYASAAQASAMSAGTANLAAAFEWYEDNLGPYLYGSNVASVAAAWGPGAFGGMEHHPLWHVSTGSLSDEETHAHEAAHGWFGNGVRIACWEDFVLSEGTVSYLAARSLEEVAGTAVSDPIWASYRSQLDGRIAWPEGCNDVDILADGLFSPAPYVKGALFYRSLEARIGRPAFDAALASFYLAHRGGAARMSDMLSHFTSETGYDPTACATSWLRSTAIPPAEVCP